MIATPYAHSVATSLLPPPLLRLPSSQLGLQDAPQVWLAAALCISGVGVLELAGGEVTGSYKGDALALLQAVGFGTSFFLTEKLMRGTEGMALPVTAVQVSVTAFICAIWSALDPSGWLFTDNNFTLNKIMLDPDPVMKTAFYAVLWTGFITTAFNRLLETLSLSKLTSAEAAVILSTEPLFAALFGSVFLKETFGWNDYVGGALIVSACLANTLTKDSKVFASLSGK